MSGDEPYFGYTTSGNQRLIADRRLAAHMGEDVRHYPAPTSDANTPDFTVDYDSPQVTQLSYDQRTQLAANDSIERIYKRIMAQDAGPIYQLSDQWQRVLQVIDDLYGRVLKAANALKYGGDGSSTTGKGWTGKGADAFLARGPGATLKSLDDWKSAAVVNWLGTAALAEAIIAHQSTMADLWRRYGQTMVQVSQKWLQQRGLSSLDELSKAGTEDEYLTHLRSISSIWSLKAQKIQTDMATAYWSVMREDLSGGRATVYEGPTDAVRPNPEFITRWQLGQFPGLGGRPPGVSPPRVSTPRLTPPALPPGLTAPDVQRPDPASQIGTPPAVTAPSVTAPSVTVQSGGPAFGVPTVVPPVLPAGSAVGQLPGGSASGLRPAALSDANRLLGNLKGASGPGVLRGATADTAPAGPPSAPRSPGVGRPSAPPQPPGAGRAPTPPQVKGRGSDQGGSGGRRGPQDPTPTRPAVSGTSDQFGRPSGASSPVLRAPKSESARGGPWRGRPAVPGPAGVPPQNGASPPVLHRPRSAGPRGVPSIRPTGPHPVSDQPPLTVDPVIGRTSRTVGETPPVVEPTGAVLRGGRLAGAAGHAAQLGSRRKDREGQTSTVDQEFDRIRRLLDDEGAWTVETPGGGVLDGTVTRAATPTAEPKPTVST